MAERKDRSNGLYEGMGERMRRRRLELAWSQEVLSERSGVSPDVIGKAENGARRVRPSTVRRLAGALGVEPEYLTTGRMPRDDSGAPMAEEGAGEASARRLERMFEGWMDEEESGGTPDRWPEVARAIDEDRASYRRLFG